MALGFYFDMTRCIGCRACQVACKDKNRLGVGVVLRNAQTYEVGSFPTVKMYNLSNTCNHCENPKCVEVCPTKAMHKAEDGTVRSDLNLCIGCGTCAAACPYQVPQVVNGKMSKCDGCAARVAKGENPACVDACTMRALDFGEYDELVAKYGEGLVSDLSILPDSKLTTPNLLIKARECALEGEARELYL